MKPDMMKRYLILLTVLVICAGAAWYFTNASAKPAEDAVLAYRNQKGTMVTAAEEGKKVQTAAEIQIEKWTGIQTDAERKTAGSCSGGIRI